MDIISVPIITILCYAAIEIIKFFDKNKKISDLYPMISAIIGGILGLIIFYTIPDLVPTNNLIHAILMGIVSGLGSTGTNQMLKRLSNYNKNTP